MIILKNTCLYIFAFLLTVSSGFCAEETDSLKVDSTSVSINPLRSHGRIGSGLYSKINKKSLPFVNYVDLSEIINTSVMSVPLNTGIYNGTNTFSLFGTLPGQNQTMLNGCPVSDFSLLQGNLGYFSPEFAENIEILTGSDAAILSENASGALVNIQQAVYNTKFPYTKLQYMQLGSNYLSLDGIFSQNIARSLNLMFGFKTQSQNETYNNTQFGSWNVRTGLRWNPDSLRSISIVDNFSNNNVQLNSGINVKNSSGSLTDDITSLSWLGEAKDRTYRHDLSASFSEIIPKLNSSQISANIYFSNSEHHARGDSALSFFGQSTDTAITYRDYYFGGNVSLLYNFNPGFNLKSGIRFSDYYGEKCFFKPANGGFLTSAFARPELRISNSTILSGGASFTNFESKGYLAGGVKLKTEGKNFSAFADLSYSETLPNDIDRKYNFNKEKQIPVIVGITFTHGVKSLEIQGFYRNISNPVLARNTGSDKINIEYTQSSDAESVFGGSILFKSTFLKRFNYSVKNTSEFSRLSGKNTEIFPAFLTTIDVNYSQVIGRSEFKIGISGTALSKFKPAFLVPFSNSYIYNSGETNFTFDGLNVYGVARLGSAFVKAGLYNIFNREFRYLNYYPMPGREIRLSASWNFLN